jgi:hypothetical protein
MKIKNVSEKYDECKKANVDLKDIPTCIWDGKNGISGLSAADKDMVKSELAKSQTVTTESGEQKDLTVDPSIIVDSYSNHPGFKKLSEIVSKHIEEELKGAGYDDKKVSSIDHTEFSTIYKTELSKSAVDATMTYCMNVNYSSTETDAACVNNCDKKSIQTEAAKCKIKCDYFTFTETELNDKTRTSKILDDITNGINLKDKVGQCVTSINSACSDKAHMNEKAKQMACTVIENLKISRKNSIINDKIIEFYKGLNSTPNLQIENLNAKNNVNQQKLLTVTSKDVEDSYKVESDNLLKLTKECENNPTLPICKKLIDTNLKDKEKAVAEFGLTQFAKADLLDTELKNKDNLKNYLLKEGIPEAEVTAALSDNAKIDDIKNQISIKFKDQKNALINELADRVKKTTSTDDGKLNLNDKSTLAQANKELQDKSEDMKKLVRFTNIASIYISYQDKDANTSRNPANANSQVNPTSLKQELGATNDNIHVESNNKIQNLFKKELAEKEENASSNAFDKLVKDILGY